MSGQATAGQRWLGSGMSMGEGQGWDLEGLPPHSPPAHTLGDPGFRLLQTWMNAPPRSMGAA